MYLKINYLTINYKVFMFNVTNRRSEQVILLVSMGQGHPRCHRISYQPHISIFDCYYIFLKFALILL